MFLFLNVEKLQNLMSYCKFPITWLMTQRPLKMPTVIPLCTWWSVMNIQNKANRTQLATTEERNKTPNENQGVMLFIKWHKRHTKTMQIQVTTVYVHVSILYLLCMDVGNPCNYNMHFEYWERGNLSVDNRTYFEIYTGNIEIHSVQSISAILLLDTSCKGILKNSSTRSKRLLIFTSHILNHQLKIQLT